MRVVQSDSADSSHHAHHALASAQRPHPPKYTSKHVPHARTAPSRRRTLLPQFFAGVRAVVSCSAVKVAPKEGDDSQRSKYMQVRTGCILLLLYKYMQVVWCVYTTTTTQVDLHAGVVCMLHSA